MRPYLPLLFFVLLTGHVFSQTWDWQNTIPVYEFDRQLPDPWAGGINSVQVNMMDLTGDGVEELILYERTAGRIRVYQNGLAGYQFIPELSAVFPEVTGWMLLRDFNGDGKKDLFTSHPLGIKMYVNTSTGGNTSWRPYDDGNVILTFSNGNNVNIYASADDVPAIDDIDGDGLLDFVTFGFLAGDITYNRNITDNPDTLNLVTETQRWGDIEECRCGIFAEGEQDCASLVGGRVEHAAARSLLTVDTDGDGDKDLLVGEDDCAVMYHLENIGTPQQAVLRNPSPQISTQTGNLVLYVYPAMFHEDIDQDGDKDLMMCTNIPNNLNRALNFRFNFYLYENIGSDVAPAFSFRTLAFLHRDMIDVGENAWPDFTDVDNDGDLDMIVGRFGEFTNEGRGSTLWLYENTGTPEDPAFNLVTNDFLELSYLSLFNMRPQVVDVNNDQQLDLAFSANRPNTTRTVLYFILNRSFWEMKASIESLIITDIEFWIDESCLVADLNGDRVVDVLIGRQEGNIEYYEGRVVNDIIEFTLDDESFLGFETLDGKPFPSFELGDMDGDSKDDLIVSYRDGSMEVFSDLLSQIDEESPVSVTYDFDFDGITYPGGETPFTAVKFAMANIFYDDIPAMVMGTGQGGIQVFRNGEAQPLEYRDGLRVFPTYLPGSEDELTIDFNRNMIVEVFTTAGQLVAGPFRVQSQSELRQKVYTLASGLYLVRIYTGENEFTMRKFIVEN